MKSDGAVAILLACAFASCVTGRSSAKYSTVQASLVTPWRLRAACCASSARHVRLALQRCQPAKNLELIGAQADHDDRTCTVGGGSHAANPLWPCCPHR